MGVDGMFQHEEEQREKRVQKRIDDAVERYVKALESIRDYPAREYDLIAAPHVVVKNIKDIARKALKGQ